eukprot:scaffold22942_cov64-Phaeocystis_antarctica.AAC.3
MIVKRLDPDPPELRLKGPKCQSGADHWAPLHPSPCAFISSLQAPVGISCVVVELAPPVMGLSRPSHSSDHETPGASEPALTVTSEDTLSTAGVNQPDFAAKGELGVAAAAHKFWPAVCDSRRRGLLGETGLGGGLGGSEHVPPEHEWRPNAATLSNTMSSVFDSCSSSSLSRRFSSSSWTSSASDASEPATSTARSSCRMESTASHVASLGRLLQIRAIFTQAEGRDKKLSKKPRCA